MLLIKTLRAKITGFLLYLLLILSPVVANAAAPTANFTLHPPIGCAIPHAVFFTDQSTDLNNLEATWRWEFGDGNTSTLQNPVHYYTTTGDFSVKLTVQDNEGSDSMTKSVSVSVPTADFTGTPLFGCGPLTTNFTDTSSSNKNITGWAWDFGDGNSSTQQNPTHTYQKLGVNTVTLTVTDANGCTDTRTRPAYVQVIGPDVKFSATPTTSAAPPLTVNFTDATIFPAPITSWTWDFNDGNSSILQNPVHTYSTYGNFDVSLTITDIDGCSRTLAKPDFIGIGAKVSATMTDAVIVDSADKNKAQPGSVIRYTIELKNTGTVDATNAELDVTIDPNTTLVPGTTVVIP